MSFNERLIRILEKEEFRHKAINVPKEIMSSRDENLPSSFFGSDLPYQLAWIYQMHEQRN